MGDAKLWAAVVHKKGIYMCLFVNVAAGLEQINSRINKTNCKERNTCKVAWNGATYVVEAYIRGSNRYRYLCAKAKDVLVRNVA